MSLVIEDRTCFSGLSAKLELPALAIYIRHDFGHIKSRRQKRPSHHAYRFCYSGSRPSYIMLSSP